ncbi:acyl carrier protein [Streptomyces sp. TRM68367]|uniref:acyl carrier protein n=1 Tax=Streptomyces sp. TRM68367 TaxID=2758415 RepID=UPI0021D372B8|nr:acyl carrier protein [Streptomyces sp. TRM68367]
MRSGEVEALVEELFKDALLKEPDEELPLQTSYFDLGLTSLRLTRLKQQMEELMELPINTNVLFNEPTVERLVLYLTDLLAGASAADPSTFEECADCGQLRHPVVRRDDGRGLCMRCWKRPMHTCVSCGKSAAAALVDDDGALCHLCYNRHRRPRRLCGRCGQLKRIARNARDGQPDLCDGCYQSPEATCSICSRVRPCTSRDPQGQPICATCYQRHRTGEPCARCGRTKPVNTRWPIGQVCMTCYTAVLRSPAECPRCRMIQPLIARGDDGTEVCGPCVGFAADYTCRAHRPHGRDECAWRRQRHEPRLQWRNGGRSAGCRATWAMSASWSIVPKQSRRAVGCGAGWRAAVGGW